MPIAIERKINEVNDLMTRVSELEEVPTTFGGGTFEHYVDIREAISTDGKFVTIKWIDKPYNLERGKERYNVSKVSAFGDDYCKKHLMYTLNIIKRAYTRALKNN